MFPCEPLQSYIERFNDFVSNSCHTSSPARGPQSLVLLLGRSWMEATSQPNFEFLSLGIEPSLGELLLLLLQHSEHNVPWPWWTMLQLLVDISVLPSERYHCPCQSVLTPKLRYQDQNGANPAKHVRGSGPQHPGSSLWLGRQGPPTIGERFTP